MARTDFKSVDEYIATFPAEVQTKLEEVRGVIKRAIPEAKEGISYQIPAYSHHGPVVYFSGFKKHISLASPPPTMEVFKDKLAGYKTSISVVQFPLDRPIPHELIAEIAAYKVKANTTNRNERT